MKKIVNVLLIIGIIFSMFGNIINAKASISARTIASPSLPMRTGSSTENIIIIRIPYNTIIDISSTTLLEGKGCDDGWYKVKYNGQSGYACSRYISFYTIGELDVERNPTNDYERTWKEAGFPSSYWEGLTALKTSHPNYTFEAIKTNIDFTEAVANESVTGTSLIQVTDLSSSKVAYISTAGGSYDYTTKKYTPLEGATWYAADSDVVAYYMDPRNFLTETRVFQFEDLSYTGTYIGKDAIEKVFSGNFSYLAPYAADFVQAGVDTGINPVYLAVLARQELGGGSNIAVSGNEFCYPSTNSAYPNEANKCYSGYYNFFNYGAGTDAKPVYNSLIYAKNYNPVIADLRPWDTPLKAISGGAIKIGSGYIKKGQNTSYFKRFNVKPGAASETYTHQYMTNVMAPFSESSSSYSSYESIGILASDSSIPFTFQVPVYLNMPVKTELPTKVKYIENYGNTIIDNLIGSTTIKTDSGYLSGFDFGNTFDTLKSKIEGASGTAKVNLYDINGNIKTIGNLATGDKVNIIYDEESQQYEIVLYGDTSGDGVVDIMDLLKVQKHIIGANSLSNAYLKAADTNQDFEVNLIDLLRVQKHILGQVKISG